MSVNEYSKGLGRREGLHAGRPEGRYEGRLEGFAETAINLLHKNLKIPLISEVTGLSEKKIRKLKQEARLFAEEIKSFAEKTKSSPVKKKKDYDWDKDWKNGWSEGWDESWEEGRLEGLREARMEAAFKMLQKKLEIPFIAEASSLLEWEIHRLKHEGCPSPKKEGLVRVKLSPDGSPLGPYTDVWKSGYLKGWRKTRQIRFKRKSREAWQRIVLTMLKKKADIAAISKVIGLSKAEFIKSYGGGKKTGKAPKRQPPRQPCKQP